ncbi:hypothetical protein MVEN_00321700 [Mycena venus]|uniref:Uncharacterized protein n=1 Tax=Mycena venus TaxID=2733690 RepID=A0A8H7D9I3_9AGAR|nr:hypothetical protein MVEN_00321700 [Mycena venus]
MFRSVSAVSKGAKKLKKKVSNLIESISSGRSRKSKSTASVASEKAAENDKHTKWTSPIYTFFEDNVETVTDSHNNRKYQAFKCKAPGGCKSKSDFLGINRYQTKVNVLGFRLPESPNGEVLAHSGMDGRQRGPQ